MWNKFFLSRLIPSLLYQPMKQSCWEEIKCSVSRTVRRMISNTHTIRETVLSRNICFLSTNSRPIMNGNRTNNRSIVVVWSLQVSIVYMYIILYTWKHWYPLKVSTIYQSIMYSINNKRYIHSSSEVLEYLLVSYKIWWFV